MKAMSCSLSLYDPAHGLYHSLPSVGLKASINIVDVYARVKLSQTFTNKSSEYDGAGEGLEAIYTFPLPPTSAVCAFEAVWDDGSRTKGIVLEKVEARKEYDEARDAGQQAGLVEQERDDIFTMHIGNIPYGGETVINVTYVIELAVDGDIDQVRFTLPTTIAPKYSSQSSQSPSYIRGGVAEISDTQGFEIDAVIEMVEQVQSVSSPSHGITVLPVLDSNGRKIKVELGATGTLDKDLVLIIKAKGLDCPRAVVELWRSVGKKADGVFVEDADAGQRESLAVGLTLVPRFAPAPLPAQEYIFLLDRSGSMQGFKIASLRNAMQLILRSLPAPTVSKTYIQIVSFGSKSSALYPHGSVAYDEDALKSSGTHCKSLEANFGGTEMAAALESSIQSRRTDIPTSLFVLTDGETWNLEQCLDVIRSAKDTASASNRLRVFSLGIGNSVDHLLVQSLARVGDGICMFVGENERLETKVVRLLRAAKGSAVRIKHVQWGTAGVSNEISLKPTAPHDDFELVEGGLEKSSTTTKPTMSLFDPDHADAPLSKNDGKSLAKDKPLFLPPLPPVLAIPHGLSCLYPGARMVVYALINGEAALAFRGEQSVCITAESDSGEAIELSVPVIETSFTANLPAGEPPLIHTLAARKLLREWADKTELFNSKVSKESKPSTERDEALAILKAQTIRLGLNFSLVSSHTSFVAIRETKEGEVLKPVRKSVPASSPPPQTYSYGSPILVNLRAGGTQSFPKSKRAGFGGARMMMAVAPSLSAPAPYTAPLASYATAPSYGGSPSSGIAYAYGMPQQQANAHSSITGRAEPQRWSAPKTLDTEKRVDALVEQQAFNGSFPSLFDVVRIIATTSPLADGVDETVWASLLALTYIDINGVSEVYDMVLEKGWGFVKNTLNDLTLLDELKLKARQSIEKL